VANRGGKFTETWTPFPAGLLEDYPQECYPTDVVSALVSIKRADATLGLDHSAFLTRALRGFTGERALDLGLPPFAADVRTGHPLDRSRVCSNAYLTMHAPFLGRGWALVRAGAKAPLEILPSGD